MHCSAPAHFYHMAAVTFARARRASRDVRAPIKKVTRLSSGSAPSDAFQTPTNGHSLSRMDCMTQQTPRLAMGHATGGQSLRLFARVDALKELRIMRQAEIQETHTLGFAIMVRSCASCRCGVGWARANCRCLLFLWQEWGAETNYSLQRGAHTVRELLTTHPKDYTVVKVRPGSARLSRGVCCG